MNKTFSKFYELEEKKRERIINSSLYEFTKNGYKNASTNKICKRANISKDSLFSYFKNKKQLYFFILSHAKNIINEIYNQIDLDEPDFFNRIKKLGYVKFELMKKYPYVFDFIKSTQDEDAKEIKSIINKTSNDLINRSLKKLYKKIDYSRFHNDIDLQKIFDIINWTMIEFAEKETNNLSSFKNVKTKNLKEADKYIEILKNCFYKEGE